MSACAWSKRLLIPLINEIFGKEIPENAEIERNANEQFEHIQDENQEEHLVRRISDTLITVYGKRYHFECESKNDGEILIRVVDYDMQIALHNAQYYRHNVTVELPDTAVIFLRKHRSLPSKGKISYVKGQKQLTYDIPYYQISRYDIDYLAEKHLYILFPFYLMRYENTLKKHIRSNYKMVENETEAVYNKLTDAYNNGILGQADYENMLELCKDVIQEISKNCQISERLVNTMRPGLLLTAEERGVVKTTTEMIKNAMKNGNMTFDQACDLLGIKDREWYRDLV